MSAIDTAEFRKLTLLAAGIDPTDIPPILDTAEWRRLLIVAIEQATAGGGGGGAVSSVNSKTGAVVLNAADVGAIGGTTGAIDNSILRADGTGGATLQNSGLIIEDTIVSFAVTGVASTDIITATGSAFANGQPVRFTALTGGSGLVTTTNYYVINVSGATFQVSTSVGGGASLFTTDITAGTLVNGHSVSTNVTISENTTETNSDFVITPKGSGAFILGPKPDGTTLGGSFRGTKSVDLQLTRASNDQVSGGINSVICGGQNNKINNTGAQHTAAIIGGGIGNRVFNNGNSAGIFCGSNNSVSSQNSGAVICGGSSNTINTGNGIIGGGSSNTLNGGSSSIIGGGQSNLSNSNFAAVLGGLGNQSIAQSAVVCGGGGTNGSNYGNTASAAQSAILGGWGALASQFGQQAHASGTFALNTATGDAQRSRFVMRCKTTTNAAVELFLDGASTRLTIPSGKIIALTINLAGVSSTGAAVAHYMRQYGLKNVTGTTTEVYAPITIGTDNASGTSLAISASDAADALIVSVTGTASTIWRWVASVDAVEIAYGL